MKIKPTEFGRLEWILTLKSDVLEFETDCLYQKHDCLDYWDWSSQTGTAEQYKTIHHFEVSTRCLAIHSDAPAFLVTQ